MNSVKLIKKQEYYFLMGNNNDTTRKYTSLLLTGTFLVLAVSGIALYVAPRCRIAEVMDWRFLFLTKETWESVHIIFAFAVILISIYHLYKNWKPFTGYLSSGKTGSRRPGKILVVSLIVVIAMFILGAFRIPPLSWISDMHEKIKASYSTQQDINGRFQRSDCPHRGQRCRDKNQR